MTHHRGRDLTTLRVLKSAKDLIACLWEDPLDRLLVYSSDLGPDEWDGCLATRTNDSIIVVRSMRAVGASSVEEFVCAFRREGKLDEVHLGEIAVVGADSDSFGRIVPEDIEQLLDDAENKRPGRMLSLTGYCDLWVLADHPASKKDE